MMRIMRPRAGAVSVALLLATLPLGPCRQQAVPSRAAPATDNRGFSRWQAQQLDELAQLHQFSGAMLLAEGGRVLVRHATGIADYASGAPNTALTRFRVGSITKSITAGAVMLLVQQGALGLGDPLCEFVASCPPAWQPVTLRHLLTHTSGIPDYLKPLTLEQFTSPTPAADLIRLVRDQPLLFRPGAEFSYSNTNYLLLGEVVERVSGQTWDAFLRDRIFKPLGMRDTGYTRDFERLRDHATGYGFTVPGSPEIAPAASSAWADGGLYSTVDDLYRWATALFRPRLFTSATLAQMRSPWGGSGFGPIDSSDVYGYGWRIAEDNRGRPVIWHGGGIPGFSSLLKVYLDRRGVVILLSNDYFSDVLQIGDQVVVNATYFSAW